MIWTTCLIWARKKSNKLKSNKLKSNKLKSNKLKSNNHKGHWNPVARIYVRAQTMQNFKDAVTAQFEKMKEHTLYRTEATGDELWDIYLSSFPEGTNPIYRERTVHDCSTCRSFIRAVGNMITDTGETLWDCAATDEYAVVAKAMSDYVRSQPIANFFLHDQRTAGVDKNYEETDEGIITYNHLYLRLPSALVMTQGLAAHLGKTKAVHDVFKRSLETITLEAVETVLELIDSSSLYRGEEHHQTVWRFKEKLSEYEGQFAYCWQADAVPIRNTVIGTLLVDLSEGKDLEGAVKSFEAKVAPTNYKRPKSVVTKGMIEKSEKKIMELGFLESLPRRYAVAEDISVADVIFADRSSRVKGIFDTLKAEAPVKVSEDVTEISIDMFLPLLAKATSVQLLMEPRLQCNRVSLIAPVNEDAPSMLKWNNNFSWVYDGDVADSMKQRVKAAGGKVDGIIRYSIQWNDEGDNNNDFDAHCIEPNGNLISYPSAGRMHQSTGILDVDIIRPQGRVAVENITWSNDSRMQRGAYTFIVHNYSYNSSRRGFTAEIEYEGRVYKYKYDKRLAGGEKVTVAICKYDGLSLEVTGGLPHTDAAGHGTEAKVSMVMYSPNHWQGQGVGNRHYFFMLGGYKTDGEARGFFNEYLSDSLTEHRKVFEILGSKMKAPATDDQISGVGFSSTQRNHFNIRVDGRPYKVQV